MPANAFDLFMAEHEPIGHLVAHTNRVLWEESALHPVVKERMRIRLAEAIGCSYCARFRTDLEGQRIFAGDESLSAEEEQKALAAERFAVDSYSGSATDELTVDTQELFTPAEFTDLVFSIGWFIGMQHVGRLMHWDQACPVAPIRKLVEAGEAA
jgi:alkylhydroperoxidase family enzyme